MLFKLYIYFYFQVHNYVFIKSNTRDPNDVIKFRQIGYMNFNLTQKI